jgi:RTX calcium-binding nonapeptide repeat (4 copies)
MIAPFYVSYYISCPVLICFTLSFLLPTLDVHAVNVIIGTSNFTIGTDEDDVIIGCSFLTFIQSMEVVQVPNMNHPEQLMPVTISDCRQGDLLIGLEGDDVLQGSSADDSIRGDEDKDQLTGADGNDKLVGGEDADVLQGGFGSDFLFGGAGNDELYSGAGDDILFGSKSADYFDCGEGYDTVIDFAPTKGDTNSDNCEVVLTHGSQNTEIICDAGSESAQFHSTTTNSEMGPNKSVTSRSSSTISVPNPLDMLCDEDEEI